MLASANHLAMNAMSALVLVLALLVVQVPSAMAGTAEDDIRMRLDQWTRDFNAGKSCVICELFSKDLKYDFRGYPERDYQDVCDRLHRSLNDASRRYAYGLDIREVIVEGDLAVVRLSWTLTVRLPNGQTVTSVEPGMDVLRKDADGQWKIVRYIAYEAPGRVAGGDE
ncbi:MAG TPA: nuclear transport factor 2 family protein [Hyphomicrobium sp.]|nr:nuclear transport factor 2 family protein [Hyphomicrobium sp.]